MKKFIIIIVLIAMCVSVWGADLSKTGISAGNDIEASHITNLYDALTGTTVYDNVDMLQCKEYTVYVVAEVGTNWSQTECANTTGGTCVINQSAPNYFKLTFSDYTFDTSGKIMLNYAIGEDLIGENSKLVFFECRRASDSTLYVYTYDYSATAVDTLAQDSNFWIRVLFY